VTDEQMMKFKSPELNGGVLIGFNDEEQFQRHKTEHSQ